MDDNRGQVKYVGQFEPVGEPEDVGGGWDKYTFDTEGGDGPICIAGTPLNVFHQERAKKDLLIVLDGGGACVQDFYLCSVLADEDPPGDSGVFADSFSTISPRSTPPSASTPSRPTACRSTSGSRTS